MLLRCKQRAPLLRSHFQLSLYAGAFASERWIHPKGSVSSAVITCTDQLQTCELEIPIENDTNIFFLLLKTFREDEGTLIELPKELNGGLLIVK